MSDLPFADRADFEDADRGLIGSLERWRWPGPRPAAQTGISGAQQAVAYLVIGAKLIGDAIGGLTG